MKQVATVLSVAMIATVIGCSGTAVEEQKNEVAEKKTSAVEPGSYPLMMGRTDEQVGTIKVVNDDAEVCVTFEAYRTHELQDAHLCVQADPFDSRVPPGQCRYSEDPLPAGATTWEVCFPIADYVEGEFCDKVIYMQAHASIGSAETGENLGSAYGSTFLGSYPYELVCEETPPNYVGCTYTQGYWKNHAKDWPVRSLKIGDVEYGSRILAGLLKMPPKKGDASLILAHQLIAAKLNVQNGAAAHPDVTYAIAVADRWMIQNADADKHLPFGTEPGTSEHARATMLAEILDQFNQGFYGSDHCE
jgi:hypothetical protein